MWQRLRLTRRGARQYGVVHYYGYGGVSRKPLPEASDALKKQVVQWLAPVMSGEEGVVAR